MINLSTSGTRMPVQAPEERTKNFNEVAEGFTEEMAVREALRCLQCREHPCMTEGCPVSNHIPDFIRKITEGEYEEAYQILMETTVLPAVCGRVCPKYLQCEGNCVRGEKGRPVAIGALERFVADLHRRRVLAGEIGETVAPQTAGNGQKKEEAATGKPAEAVATEKSAKAAVGKKVAVIGSGPAGLACAKDLAAAGYAVTVFDREEVPGGVLSYGIPAFRLPDEVLAFEVDSLAAAGVTFEAGKELGKNISIDSLMKDMGYSAVFLGNGAGAPMGLGIPGTELSGVVSAADFLSRLNEAGADPDALKKVLPDPGTIAIIGGGNVAMDACRSAVRIPGAEKVEVIYRRSVKEMPADPAELAEAMEEGVEFIYLTAPLEVLGEGGKVTGLRCQRMELSEPDASGRRKPVPVEGSEYVLPVSAVIEAIGSRSENAGVDGVDVSADRGLVIADPETLATSRPGVYAGGDTVTGPKTVIAAMGAGRRAARAIDRYLKQ